MYLSYSLFGLNLVDMHASTRVRELCIVVKDVVVVDLTSDRALSQYLLLRACKRL